MCVCVCKDCVPVHLLIKAWVLHRIEALKQPIPTSNSIYHEQSSIQGQVLRGKPFCSSKIILLCQYSPPLGGMSGIRWFTWPLPLLSSGRWYLNTKDRHQLLLCMTGPEHICSIIYLNSLLWAGCETKVLQASGMKPDLCLLNKG